MERIAKRFIRKVFLPAAGALVLASTLLHPQELAAQSIEPKDNEGFSSNLVVRDGSIRTTVICAKEGEEILINFISSTQAEVNRQPLDFDRNLVIFVGNPSTNLSFLLFKGADLSDDQLYFPPQAIDRTSKGLWTGVVGLAGYRPGIKQARFQYSPHLNLDLAAADSCYSSILS